MGIKHYLEEHATELTIQDYHKISNLLAKIVDNCVDNIENVKRKIICIINNGHYTKETAEEDVAKMYYDDSGKRYAPYWEFSVIEQIYNNYMLFLNLCIMLLLYLALFALFQLLLQN